MSDLGTENILFDYRFRPKTAWLNVNRQCNFRCRWCYGSATGFSKDDTMTYELAERLIHISKDIGVDHIIFIGGEPTLWDDLFRANKLCHDMGLTTGLITNGAKFENDKYWEKYLENEVDRLSISIKAADADMFKKATGILAFDNAKRGIERAASRNNVFMTTVYNSLVGMNGFKEIVNWVEKMGAERFIVTLCSPTEEVGYVKDEHIVPLKRLSDSVNEIVSYLREKYNGNFQIDVQMPLCLFCDELIDELLENGELQTICHVFSRKGISFLPTGDVAPCNELFDTVIARIDQDYSDADTLINHMNSNVMKSFYRELVCYPSTECNFCDRKTDCRGGCLMNWLIYEPEICKAVQKGVVF